MTARSHRRNLSATCISLLILLVRCLIFLSIRGLLRSACSQGNNELFWLRQLNWTSKKKLNICFVLRNTNQIPLINNFGLTVNEISISYRKYSEIHSVPGMCKMRFWHPQPQPQPNQTMDKHPLSQVTTTTPTKIYHKEVKYRHGIWH